MLNWGFQAINEKVRVVACGEIRALGSVLHVLELVEAVGQKSLSWVVGRTLSRHEGGSVPAEQRFPRGCRSLVASVSTASAVLSRVKS